jgi:hypothetical protein
MKKSSQKYVREMRKSKNHQHLNSQDNRENVVKNEQTKYSGIDVNKYKGMIEKLRNSYEMR